MTDQPKYDRFTPPGEIPEISPPRGGGPDRCGSATPATPPHGEGLSDEERRRGYAMQSPAGRGWEPEDSCSDPQTPGGARPRALASSQKLGRPVGLAAQSADHGDQAPSRAVRYDYVEIERPLHSPKDYEVVVIETGTLSDTSDPAIERSASGQRLAMTGAKMATFLECMATFGNVSVAAAKAQVARQTAYAARRRCPGFARAWDAAMVAARSVAECTLAERAIDGVEEVVYYRGEEIGRRRKHDARLLLAHLARLDKAAERLDVAAAMPLLDQQIAALRDGAEPEEALPARPCPEALREAQEERDRIENPRASEAGEDQLQDTVTPVQPCPDCGGLCADAAADRTVTLTEADCMWLGNRLERMDAARPRGAPGPGALATGYEEAGELELLQLAAFERGEERWWEAAREQGGAERGGRGGGSIGGTACGARTFTLP